MSFLQAVDAGDIGALLAMLSEDVTLWADGGGKIKGAATHPVSGNVAVARFSIGATRRFLPEGSRVEFAEVNREPAIVIRDEERAYLVLTIEVETQRIHTIRIIANPEKLMHV